MTRWLSVSVISLLALFFGSALISAAEFPFRLMSALNLSAEDAAALEARLKGDPHDLSARSELIIYYFAKTHGDPAIRRTRDEHVLWLIGNAPHAEILGTPHAQIFPFPDAASYEAGKSAWLSHIERDPDNAVLVGHAANFISPIPDRELSVEMLRRAQELDPENSHWPTMLGHQYDRDASFGEETSSALLALEQFERAYELADGIERSHLLTALAKAAFSAERYEDARTYATTMLEEAPAGWDEGNQIHHGNLILGRLALLGDDVEQAKHHLLEAGRISGGPSLGTFGPNMQLAADLVERGERAVVLEYFELCSNFWPNDKLKDWAALVRAGRTPDFQANLVY